jgi:hypothetical protein
MSPARRSPEEERLRQLIREEARMTVGELRRALRAAKGKKVAAIGGEAAKKIGLYGLKAALGALPGGGTLSAALEAGLDVADVIGKAGGMSTRERTSSPLWDLLSIDPDVSDVVDDDLENRFIKKFADGVSGLPDDAPLPDADATFSQWLSGEYGGVKVSKDPKRA